MTIKILVPIKRVVDANVRVRVNGSGHVDTAGLKMSINPFDECALEKALRLRDAGAASHVTVITCASTNSQDVLRTALAMGANDAVLLDTIGFTGVPDSLAIAKLLQAFIGQDSYGLVLCGKQAIDDDTGGVPAMLAALLGWPQALNVSEVDSTGSGWQVVCGDDAGTATWRLEGAAVISADLRLAEARRVTLPNIIKAKQKPLRVIDAAVFGIDLAPRTRWVELADPPIRQAGVKLADTGALLAALDRDGLLHYLDSGVS